MPDFALRFPSTVLGLEAGSEQYVPLTRAIVGGLGISVVVFPIPAVFLLRYEDGKSRLLSQERFKR